MGLWVGNSSFGTVSTNVENQVAGPSQSAVLTGILANSYKLGFDGVKPVDMNDAADCYGMGGIVSMTNPLYGTEGVVPTNNYLSTYVEVSPGESYNVTVGAGVNEGVGMMRNQGFVLIAYGGDI